MKRYHFGKVYSLALLGIALLSVSVLWHLTGARAAGDINADLDPEVRSGACPYDMYEPNHSFADAYAIVPNMPYDGIYICPEDDEAWFRFSVSSGQQFTVHLYNLPEDFDLYLYAPDESEEGWSMESGTDDEQIVHTASQNGDYRVQIVGWAGAYSEEYDCTLLVELGASATATPTSTVPSSTTTPTSTVSPATPSPTATSTWTPTTTYSPTPTGTPTPSPTASPTTTTTTECPAGSSRMISLPLVMRNWVAQIAGGWVSPNEGGTVSLPDGRLSVSVPTGAVERRTLLTLSQGAAAPPEGASDLDYVFQIVAEDELGQPVTHLNKPATLSFQYKLKDMIGVIPSELEVHARGANGTWQALPSQVDTQARVIRAQTSHFSYFGLFGQPLTGRLGDEWESADVGSILHINVDDAGNMYLARTIDGRSITLYRRPPGADRETLLLYLMSTDYLSLSQFSMTIEPGTGVLYLSLTPWDSRVPASLVRVEPYQGNMGMAETRVVYQDTSTCYRMGQTHFSPADQTLWVECIHSPTLRQLNTTTFEVLRGITAPPHGWIVDSRGRLYGLSQSSRKVYSRDQAFGYSLDLMVYDEGAQTWRKTAEGFGYSALTSGPQMASDNNGNVFILNADWDQTGPDRLDRGNIVVSVVNGDEPVARTAVRWEDSAGSGMIASGAGKLLVRTVGRSGVPGSLSSLRVFPTQRLDPDIGNMETISLLHDTISGHNSIVTLVGGLSKTPAHQGLWLDGQRLPLVRIERDRLVYGLPAYTDDFRYHEDDALLYLGRQTKNLGPFDTPEQGNWKSWHGGKYAAELGRSCIIDEGHPLDFAVGEWGLWKGEQWIVPVSISSREGLFEPWVLSEQDPHYRYEWWFTYRFTTPGLYTFDVETKEHGVKTCKIRVSYEGSPLHWYSWFDIDPARGGRFFNNGAMLEIPAGALPGAAPYRLRLDSRSTAAPPVTGGYPSDPTGYQKHEFYFDPEPEELLADLHYRVLYDPHSPAEIPRPTYYDDGQNPEIPSAYWMSSYVPMYHTVDENKGHVSMVLEAGGYSGGAVIHRPGAMQSQSDGAGDYLSIDYWGEKIKTGINTIGKKVQWRATGSSLKKVETANFSILYNPLVVSEDKAQAALEGLSMARIRFRTWGYQVPNAVIVVLSPWAPDATSGIGTLGHWYIVLAAWPTEDDIRTAAAHECFHTIQYENMSYAARARKKSWDWWMEGTAVWAETVTYPDNNSAGDWVKDGSDFIHRGLYGYDSLSGDQAYACVALVSFLEQRHPGAVLQVLQQLGATTGPARAIASVVGDLDQFYVDFAEAFFSQKEEPYKSWNLNKAFNAMTLTAPKTTLFSQQRPAYSALSFKLIASSDPAAPISFREADGSVLRVSQSTPKSVTGAWSHNGDLLGDIDGISPAEGLALARAHTFTPAAPLKLAYINLSTAGPATVVFEVPTLESVWPTSFPASQQTLITANGAGFGALPGALEIQGVNHVADSWTETYVSKTLPAGTVSPGTVVVRVRHASGVYSNPRQITAQ